MDKTLKRRVAIEIIIGAAAIILFAYIIFRLEPGERKKTVSIQDTAVTQAINSNTEKLMIIGVDGATWDVALDLVGAGRMPNLERLLKQGAHGNLVSTPPLISPAIWTSFATGVPRQVHGIDNFLYKIPFEYKLAQSSARIRRVPALWNMVASRGKKAAVVNWYAGHPPEPIQKGVYVSEGIAPEKIGPEQVWPDEWIEKIKSLESFRNAEMEYKLGRYNHPVIQKSYDLDGFVTAIGAEILRTEQPDLMMIYLRNLDVVCHGFWKYRRPAGLEYYYSVSEAERKRFGDAIETYYEYTDWLIGKLMEAAGDYTVMIMSDHGFEATYPPKNIYINLNRLLEQMGYLEYSGPTCEAILENLLESGELRVAEPPAYNMFFACEAMNGIIRSSGGSENIAAFLLEHKMIERRQLEEQPHAGIVWESLDRLAALLRRGNIRQDIIWRRTSLFNMEDFHKDMQGIFINLDGRDPEGIIREQDYKKFRAQAIDALRELRTESGERLFKKVEANPDKNVMPLGVDDPPDILLQFNREVLGDNLIKRSHSDNDPIPLGSILWSYEDVSGDHAINGMWLVSGPGTAGFEPLDVKVLDIAPTSLWFLGFPVGADMPGNVLRQAFSDEKSKHEPLYVESWTGLAEFEVKGPPAELSPEKREQMRALGYIQH